MRSINPFNNTVIKDYPEHTAQETREIIEKVDLEFKSWSKTSFKERARIFNNISDVLLKNQEDYARLITIEMGKLIKESRLEIEKSARVCRYYAENAEKILQDEIVETDYVKSFVTFEPQGTILAIMPWNYPFWQVIRFLAPCLMSGNTALLKHAANVQGCASEIENILLKAGLPENAFRNLIIPTNLVQDVIEHPAVKGITLTGGEEAGSQVAAAAGKKLKKTVMELGGSDPFIVLEDADMDKAVETSIKARTTNAGQTCISAKRFIVMEGIAKEFEERHAAKMASLKIGDPLDETTQFAPMVSQLPVQQINNQVQGSLKQGARLVAGGFVPDMPGSFYAPTVLSDVRKGMPVYDEETFGPVSAIIVVNSEEEAIEVANDTPYGLGASIWTSDLARGERMARQIDSGMVYINTLTTSNPKLPFGGTKLSGYGRETSHYGIKEFLNIKSICIN